MIQYLSTSLKVILILLFVYIGYIMDEIKGARKIYQGQMFS